MNANRVLNAIREQVSAESLINSCSGEGCRVYMTGIPSDRVVIDVEGEFDSRNMTEKRCDRLLFYIDGNNLVAAPIELKRGKAEQSEVIEKLQNSLHFAASIVPRTVTTAYRPILFEGRGIKWTNPSGTKQLNVSFRGTLRIRVGRCGRRENLAKALSEPDEL